MNRIDVMVDLETFGTDPSSTIFQIAAVAFDITSGEHKARFNQIADISKNESYEMTVSGSTLKWWLNTDKELLTELLNKGEGSSDQLIEQFKNWLNSLHVMGEVHLWGNGMLFDNLFLKQQMGDEYPIRFTHDRDLRTVVDLTMIKTGMDYKQLKEKFQNPLLTKHDAMNDVKNQIDLLRGCYDILLSGEIPSHTEADKDVAKHYDVEYGTL